VKIDLKRWQHVSDIEEVEVEVEVEVKLRPIVSRPVRIGVRRPSWTRYQCFLLVIFVRKLLVCYFVAPSLTIEWVCNLLLLLVLASAVPLGSEYHGTQDHILLSQFLRLPQPGGPGLQYLYPPGTGWPSYTPGHWVPFPSPLTTRKATVVVFYPASTRDCVPHLRYIISYLSKDVSN
jgi:hypothetical protein